ncbi:hydroxymethylbilane synthase [Woeseiaceae bacterium]|jgi:hydroxymethylbilane synthase|nr:hydroxymethylbilane synthase [Woeseiaceae bacterium]
MDIRIATRKSELALWQAKHVAVLLNDLPEINNVTLVPLSTKGDQILDTSLQKIGGKGLFIKELEVAMTENRADIAVHSMKDMPVVVPTGFCIAATLERESPFDALISKNNQRLLELPKGSIIGSSSLRRQAQILNIRPDIKVKDLRGNVNTRINKLDRGEYDAIVLAYAGLKRLGLSERISQTFLPEDMVPAAAQGVIGIECQSEKIELIAILAQLNNKISELTTSAERSVNRDLQATCQSPIGTYAIIQKDKCIIESIVASPDGSKIIRELIEGHKKETKTLGARLAARLIKNGADEILNINSL